MKEKLKKLHQELKDAQQKYSDFWKGKNVDEELTLDEKNFVKSLGKKADEAKEAYTEFAEMCKRNGEAEEFLKAFNKPTNDLGEGSKDGVVQEPRAKNFVQLLKEDSALIEQIKSNPRSFKTLITSSTSSAGDLLTPQRLDSLYDPGLFRRELSVLDIIRRIPVSTESVEWPYLDSVTNAAAPVGIADSIATTDDTGRFPESAMVWDKKSVTMKWIGHTIPVPESVLSDIPQLLGYINEFMIYGIREELEDQFLVGDGTGENLTGILATAGIQTQAFDTDLLKTLRKAKTKAKKVGRVSRISVVTTPEIWESLELMLDGEDRYLLGGPVGTLTAQLWGMPIVENEGVTANHAIVGGFDHCVWFDRMAIEVAAFFENRDFIEKNLVAIRARTRAQVGITRPKAFVDATMTV
jgi:HK97 family phage major capsid protein